MGKKQGDYPIPFNAKTGGMLSYPTDWGVTVEWRENVEFAAELTFESFSRGRSSAIAIFKADDGRKFPMFLTCLSEAMQHLAAGKLSGWFMGTKRGENYSIRFVRPLES